MRHFEYIRSFLVSAFGTPAIQLAQADRMARHGEHAIAFPLWIKAARKGLPAAHQRIGNAYWFGRGVPKSASSALRWLRRAADAQDPAAQTMLASLALQGVSRDPDTSVFETTPAGPAAHPDYSLALHWAERAAGGGSNDARTLLGHILTDGPEHMRDPARGDAQYQQAADDGSPHAMLGRAQALLRSGATDAACRLLEQAAAGGVLAAHYVLGLVAESGINGAPDHIAATGHYAIGARLGQPQAGFRYGLALLTGRGVAADPLRAESWLRRAAIDGETKAAAVMGHIYLEGRNPVEAALWLRLAAEAGNPVSARALARLSLGHDGFPRNIEEALHWLRLAIGQGDAGATDDMARLVLAGHGEEGDRRVVVEWFRTCAGTGQPEAMLNLGLCLMNGIGVSKDDALALQWLERAATTLPAAQYWCGRLVGGREEHAAARAWFLLAAGQGNADAEVAAGEMLINGRGGAAESDTAIMLFRRAAAVSHPGALLALKLLGQTR